MKSFLLFFVCFTGSLLQAQTAIIAHKSHAGTASDFFIDPSTNFGIPSPRLVQVIRLNDSTSIEVYDNYQGYYEYDTVYKNPTYANYDLDLDSITKSPFHRNVEYINFKKSPKSLKPKSPGFDTEKLNELAPKTSIEQKQEPVPRKKKKSYLLFLFGITGGGLLAIRILSRIFTPQVTA